MVYKVECKVKTRLHWNGLITLSYYSAMTTTTIMSHSSSHCNNSWQTLQPQQIQLWTTPVSLNTVFHRIVSLHIKAVVCRHSTWINPNLSIKMTLSRIGNRVLKRLYETHLKLGLVTSSLWSQFTKHKKSIVWWNKIFNVIRTWRKKCKFGLQQWNNLDCILFVNVKTLLDTKLQRVPCNPGPPCSACLHWHTAFIWS